MISLRGLFLKAGILGFLWLFLPFWIFLAASFYFYFFPFFQPLRLALPFFLTLIAAAILPANIWLALFLAALFFLILGIKNLIFVNRLAAHQFLVFFLLFLLFLSFFSGFENWQHWIVSFSVFGVSAVFLLLAKELVDYGGGTGRRRTFFILGFGALLIWQLCLVLLFLPLNYFYETALLLLSAVFLLDVLLEHLKNKLDGRKILTDFSIFFALSAVILASARWGF